MGGLCRELLTLQLGHYSNFVGTHWWNIQDAALSYDADRSDTFSEINNNVLFREGQTQRGRPTYTPRLILFDLKGSLSSLKQEGNLYGVSQAEPALTWRGSLALHREDPATKNQFLQQLDRLGGETHSGNVTSATGPGEERCAVERPRDLSQGAQRLEGDVKVWSDFLGVRLHPKTISIIQQYSHESTSNRFEAFGFGEKLVREPAFLEDFEDRLHFYIEECDYLQGFQVLCDLQDGFAGLTAKVLELLHDEYEGKAIFTCGLAPSWHADTGPVASVYRLLNSVMGTVQLASRSSIFCPMSLDGNLLSRKPASPALFPHLLYNAAMSYHSSAPLAAALETLSLPYRLRDNPITLSHMADALSISGRKVVSAAAAVPLAVGESETLPDALANQGGCLPWTPLSPGGEIAGNVQCFAQSVVARGIGRDNQVSNLPPGVEGRSPLHHCPTGEDVIDRFLHDHYPTAMSAVHLIQTPCRVTTPFPQLFSAAVTRRGRLTGTPATPARAVETVPVLTALQSLSATSSLLQGLQQEVGRLTLPRFAAFFAAGTEMEDFGQVVEELRTLAQCYRPEYELQGLDMDSDPE